MRVGEGEGRRRRERGAHTCGPRLHFRGSGADASPLKRAPLLSFLFSGLQLSTRRFNVEASPAPLHPPSRAVAP